MKLPDMRFARRIGGVITALLMVAPLSVHAGR